ncbi:MAG: flagellar protein FlgN [Christensenellales bacterium]
MDRLITALQAVLKQETKEYGLILALAGDKKESLLKNDVAELERIVAKEWVALKNIKQLETEREGLIGKIAVLCRMPKETLRLEHIIDVLDNDIKQDFKRIKKELESVLEELSEQNFINKGLIDTHLAYSAFCVNLLTGHLNKKLGVYSHSGAMMDRHDTGNLLVDQMV